MSASSTTVELASAPLPTLYLSKKRPQGKETLVAAPTAKTAKFDEIYEWENAVIPSGLVAIFTEHDEWYLPHALDTSVTAMQEIDRVSKEQLKLLEGPESAGQRNRRENKQKREKEKEREAQIGTPDSADKEVTSGTAARRNKAKAETVVKKAAAAAATTTKHGKNKKGKKKSSDDEFIEHDE